MLSPNKPVISDTELVDSLRHAASVWFKNSDLLLLEELILRYHREKQRNFGYERR